MLQYINFTILLLLLFLVSAVIYIYKRKNTFKNILKSISSPYAILKKNGKVLLTNDAFLKLLNYSTNNRESLSIDKIIEENSRQFIFDKIVSKSSVDEIIKIKCMRNNGKILALNTRVKKIGNEIYLEIIDENRNLEAEKKLRESQRLLSTLISNLPGIVFLTDSSDILTMKFVSDGCYDLTGYEPIDIIDNNKLSFNSLIHEDDRENVKNIINDSIKNNRAYHISYRIVLSGKEEKWVWERGKPIFTSDNEFLAIGGFISDVTEYKLMEKKIEEEKEKLAVTLRSIGDGVITTDTQGRVILVNKVAEKLTGWTQKEAGGRPLSEIFNIINEKT